MKLLFSSTASVPCFVVTSAVMLIRSGRSAGAFHVIDASPLVLAANRTSALPIGSPLYRKVTVPSAALPLLRRLAMTVLLRPAASVAGFV